MKGDTVRVTLKVGVRVSGVALIGVLYSVAARRFEARSNLVLQLPPK